MAESYIGPDYTLVPGLDVVPTSPCVGNIGMEVVPNNFTATPTTSNSRRYLMIALDSLGNPIQWMASYDDATGAECNTPNKPLSGISIEGRI